MKKIIINALLSVLPTTLLAQFDNNAKVYYNELGQIAAVEYYATTDQKINAPKSPTEFFREVLKTNISDTFKEIRNDQTELFLSYDQYYKGIPVEHAGYTFHYNVNGDIEYAHGDYVEIKNLRTTPSISDVEAIQKLKNYLKAKNVYNQSSKLMIKKISISEDQRPTPMLVYKVFLHSDNPTNEIYGYVDAHTGEVLSTESAQCYASATGTFELIYNDNTKTAQTQPVSGGYRLYDDSRGAIIYTRDLANHKYGSVTPSDIYDSDNYWHRNEHLNNTDMAMDVHWGLQKIYDRLYNAHNKNSYDNNGKTINAFVRAIINNSTSNASWNTAYEVLSFGKGGGAYSPYASIDVVAHEYGHAITQYQVGWSDNLFNEGLSDIWACIMEYRILGNSDNVWKIGEQLKTIGSLRNIKNPNSYTETEIATTYLSNYYNNSTDKYVRSGVFSRWFYWLVNGGHTINDKGYYYNLTPVGMDVAENLVVKAVFGGYLRYTSSYPEVRTAFENAAQALGISGLRDKVHDAWCAVGVGDEGNHLFISGPTVVSNTSNYEVANWANNLSADWYISEDDYYNNNCLQENSDHPQKCSITRDNGQDMYNATLNVNVKKNNTTLKILTKKVYAYAGFKGTYYNGQTTKQINLPNPLYVRPGTDVLITSPNLEGATLSYTGSATPYRWYHNSDNGTLNVGMPSTNNATLVVNVNCDNGDSYYLPIIVTTNSNLLSINVLEGYFEVIVTPEFGNEDQQRTDIGSALRGNSTWTIEVFNATTGECILKQKVEGSEQTFSTSGWKPGIYVVQVTIGDEELTEKIVVK